MGDPPNDRVSFGPTSYAGYGGSAIGVILALLAYKNGDRSDQTLGVIAAGAFAALAFVTTTVGRYAQAVVARRRPQTINQNVVDTTGNADVDPAKMEVGRP